MSNENKLAQAIDMNDQSPPGVNENSEMALEKFEDVISGIINKSQFDILQGRTPKHFIKKRPGKGGQTFSYVPHGYVTSVLNKAFGFDWDLENITPRGPNGEWWQYLPAKDMPKKRGGVVRVAAEYTVIMQLTVRIHDMKDKRHPVIATITKTSTGSKEEVPGMTQASHIKSAEMDGKKKAASQLGVANDLYWQTDDTDYIPAEKLSPQQQALVDAIGTVRSANSGTMPAPPLLRNQLADMGHDYPLPVVIEAFALYQKQQK